jgi:hypothetical protein
VKTLGRNVRWREPSSNLFREDDNAPRGDENAPEPIDSGDRV